MGKTTLITGIGRRNGIGFHVAQALLQRGHTVYATVRNISSTRPILNELGDGCIALEVNLENPDGIKHFTKSLKQKIKTLDVLINNAGTLVDQSDPLSKITAEQFLQTMQVNTLAPLLLFQGVLDLLKAAPAARVINVSSAAGKVSGDTRSWAPAYSMSKAALNALTRQMAGTYPEFSINSVCPGWCHTDMGGKNAPRTPEQGADTIVWLADEAPQTLTDKFLRDRGEIPW